MSNFKYLAEGDPSANRGHLKLTIAKDSFLINHNYNKILKSDGYQHALFGH